uniref:EamA domain-containing protein n=1 Tax=Panagrolaimus sp. JU765 TaxID=591449 RepID=A0AC34R4J6_9BILA
MLKYAVGAGLCASLAPIFMKLAFPDEKNESQLHFYTFIICFILSNVFMWWLHSKAMKMSDNTIKAIVLNTGSNFVFTGIFGWLIFNEQRTIFWVFGVSFILAGIFLISRSNQQQKSFKND